MASYIIYVAVSLCIAVSTVDSQECDNTYDTTDCVYDVYCAGDSNLYHLYELMRDEYDRNQDSSYCRYEPSRFYDNSRGDNMTPLKLKFKDSGRKDLTQSIPNFNNDQILKAIISFNLSDNEYSYVPTFNTMENLATLDLSRNHLKIAKLSNENELPSLTSIDYSQNIISKIEITGHEHAYETLVNINLSYNYLVRIPDAIFNACGDLESLDVSHNYIEVLTSFTFEGVRNLLHLNISYNRIANIDSSLFRFNKLLTLNFGNNKLQDVKRSDFDILSSLYSLDLSSNSISSVDGHVFDNMGLLKKIDLSNNRLGTFAKEAFINMTNIKEINLSENHFKELPRGMFKGKTVSAFWIEGNALTGSLVRGTFEGFQLVSELDLSNQQLTSLEDFAFFGLENVQKILLNNNNIQSLSKSCFKTLQHLYELDLSYNKITNIDFNKEDLVSLQSLLLRNNLITQVKYEYLQNLNLLQVLDLSYNNITHLETDSFKLLKELTHFEISNNPLGGALEENTFEGLNSLPNLDISRSMMTTICNNSFMSMVQLRDLNVSYSKIEDLQYNAFRKTGAIQSIDLSFNQLDVFNINTTELTSLRTLLLNGNHLVTVGKDTFRGLISLMKVALSNNNIFNINNDAFIDQKDLRHLDLSYNSHLNFNVTFLRTNKNLNTLNLLGITSVTNFTHANNIPIFALDISHAQLKVIETLKLKDLTRLDTLVLNNNNIVKLEGKSFENVKTLRNLDVSYNHISFIQPGTFKDNSLLYSLNISHNALTAIGYGIFRSLIYLHTLDMSFNEIDSLESERFYEVTSLNILIADHNRIATIKAEDFMGISLRTLSIGGNPLPCDILVKLKNKVLPFEITAIKLEDKTDHENIDGVTCNMNRGYLTNSLLSNSSVNEVSNTILIDIRDILLKNNKLTDNSNNNTMPTNNVIKFGEDISSQLLNISNKMEKSLANSTKKLESNMVNSTSLVVNEINLTNTLLGKISKIISANWRTFYTPIKQNQSESLLPYIEGVKMDLENAIAAEKDRVINEIDKKLAVINSRIDSMSTIDTPKHEKYVANEVQTPTESLFTKTCLGLILSMMVCIILYKFYKSRIYIRNRLSISTRELPGAMEHSAL